MLKFGFGVASAALATAFAAGAASAQGSYVSASVGYTQLDNVDTGIEDGISAGNDIFMTFAADEDYNVHAAYGWDLGAVRLEAEAGYANFNVSQYESRNPPNITRPASGSLTSLSLMGNLYYDFGDAGGFAPYLGFGAGAVRTEFEANGPLPTAPAGPVVTIVNDDAINVAWQAMAGLSIPLGGNMTVTGEYRYQDAGSYDLVGFAGHASHVDVKGSSLNVGLRIGF